jgi:hypothetical protein
MPWNRKIGAIVSVAVSILIGVTCFTVAALASTSPPLKLHILSKCDRQVGQELRTKFQQHGLAPPTQSDLQKVYQLCPSSLNHSKVRVPQVTFKSTPVAKATLMSETFTVTQSSPVLHDSSPNCILQVEQAVVQHHPTTSATKKAWVAQNVCDYVAYNSVFFQAILPAAAKGPRPHKAFPGPNTVVGVGADEWFCAPVSCLLWRQDLKELYYYNHQWVWQTLDGYTNSYINCYDHGGTGFSVSLQACPWGGSNPGWLNHPLTATCYFEVSFLFYGFPISHSHWLEEVDQADGQIQYLGS